MNRLLVLLATALWFPTVSLTLIGAVDTNSTAQIEPSAKIQDWPTADPAAVEHWRSLRFGMFIHWGPVSLTGKEIGWSRGAQTPVDVYDNLYHQFNPTNFNADQWVSIAKTAGVKYIVLTTKHHDGFCLWDTTLSDYNIMNSPFRRDVVKELAAACKKQNIEFGAYYSTCDWHNTNWPATSPGGKIMRAISDMDAYEKYLQGQISELITNYGPLLTIWNDVPNHNGVNFGKRGAETIKLVRQLQPNILINNRTGDGGDYDTPEQKIGKFQMERPWESCMTISAHDAWAWGGTNDGVKSVATCLEMLVRGAGGDGNILLNVGPRPDGIIDPAQENVLKHVGEWLIENGEAIYGTRGGPFMPGDYGASTRKGRTVYVHILKWPPSGVLRLPTVSAKLSGARILSGGRVDAWQTEAGLDISVPESSRLKLVTVIALEFDSDVRTLPAVSVPVESAIALTNAAPAFVETATQRDARMSWWREARFGMFVHWGLYSGLAGTWNGRPVGTSGGMEWIQQRVKVDTDTYAAAALPRFQPKPGFAREWAKLAKQAGCRYLVFTTKHHEGFGLYASQFGDYNAGAKLNRDLVKEIVEACRAEGLRVGFYHSLIDWHHDQYDYPRARGLPHPLAGKPSPNGPRDHAKYIDYLHNQVGELMSNYGPVDIVWWDFSSKEFQGDEAWRATDLIREVRARQPQIIMDNRLFVAATVNPSDEHAAFTTDHGDFTTPEQHIPATGIPGVDWETCMTLNTTWGYSEHDHAWKTTTNLIRNLVDIASKGGNYLLNIGPRGDGSLTPETVESFQAIGAWMKANGESIYGTTASPFAKLDWGRATQKGRVIYLQVFDWPQNRKLIVPLKNNVKEARLLSGNVKLRTSRDVAGLAVRLPAAAPDAIASVIKLTLTGNPEVLESK